jgi:hypothetical protein
VARREGGVTDALEPAGVGKDGAEQKGSACEHEFESHRIH